MADLLDDDVAHDDVICIFADEALLKVSDREVLDDVVIVLQEEAKTAVCGGAFDDCVRADAANDDGLGRGAGGCRDEWAGDCAGELDHVAELGGIKGILE